MSHTKARHLAPLSATAVQFGLPELRDLGFQGPLVTWAGGFAEQGAEEGRVTGDPSFESSVHSRTWNMVKELAPKEPNFSG
jgi:hypothetical protein